MSTTKTVIVEVEVKDAVKSVDKLKKSISGINEEVKETGETSEKSFNKMEKGSDGAKKGLGGVAKGFKGIGTALKAAGIGLIIAVFAAFAKVLSENQVVMDKVKVAGEAIQIVFNDLISFITNSWQPAWDGVKNFFDNLTFENVGKAIKENLIERFESLIDVFGFVADAIRKLVKGDFEGAWDALKDAGKESIDVFTGVNDTFDKTVEVVSNLTNSVISYGSEVLKSAEANVKLAKSAEIAVAQQAQLVEIYDRQAEQLRQIRDDESKAITERIKANDKLLETLDKQEKAMIDTANAILASAQAQYDKNQNDENYIALIDAQTNKLGVLAQIEGFRSEQKVNEIALDKELVELTNSKLESDTQLALEAKRFQAERIQNEEIRVIRLRELLEEEKIIEQERLQAIIDGTNEGTQARVDAEIAYNERMQELDQELILSKEENKNKEVQFKSDVVSASANALDSLIAIAGQETALGKALLIAKQVAAAAEIAIGISKIQFKATETVAMASLEGAESTAAVAGGAAKTLSLGFPAAIPMLIGYAAAAIGIVASVVTAIQSSKKTASKYGGSGGGGVDVPRTSSSVASPVSASPSFNVVGQSGENQLAQTIAGQQQEPIKAYVVSTEVSSQQSLDRSIEEEATFG